MVMFVCQRLPLYVMLVCKYHFTMILLVFFISVHMILCINVRLIDYVVAVLTAIWVDLYIFI